MIELHAICEKLVEVKLETADWWPEPAGDSEMIHYRAKCQGIRASF
jgi:hypothetical protein